jgi:hypothetical protein
VEGSGFALSIVICGETEKPGRRNQTEKPGETRQEKPEEKPDTQLFWVSCETKVIVRAATETLSALCSLPKMLSVWFYLSAVSHTRKVPSLFAVARNLPLVENAMS